MKIQEQKQSTLSSRQIEKSLFKLLVDLHSCNYDVQRNASSSSTKLFDISVIISELDLSHAAGDMNLQSTRKDSLGQGDKTGETVATKTMQIIDPNEGIHGSIIKEVSLLKELDHDYIVRLLDVRRDEHSFKLIFEYLDSDLHTFIQNFPPMSSFMIKRLLHQILHGIAYLDTLNLFHGDLKPDCVAVDTKGRFIKIADTGSVKPIGLRSIDEILPVENHKYRAPEILLGDSNASTAANMWAVGCMFAEMATKKPLFLGNSAEDVLHEIFRVCGPPNEATWPGVTSLPNFNITLYFAEQKWDLENAIPDLESSGMHLLSKMLCLNPVERITAKAALDSPFFDH